jgi:hypothetical protein
MNLVRTRVELRTIPLLLVYTAIIADKKQKKNTAISEKLSARLNNVSFIILKKQFNWPTHI